jgi:hypothetical protein
MSYSSSVFLCLTVAQQWIIPRLFVAAGTCLPNRCLINVIFRLDVTETYVSNPFASNGLFRLSGVMSQYLQFTVNLYNLFHILLQILECNNIHFKFAYFAMKYQTSRSLQISYVCLLVRSGLSRLVIGRGRIRYSHASATARHSNPS